MRWPHDWGKELYSTYTAAPSVLYVNAIQLLILMSCLLGKPKILLFEMRFEYDAGWNGFHSNASEE